MIIVFVFYEGKTYGGRDTAVYAVYIYMSMLLCYKCK